MKLRHYTIIDIATAGIEDAAQFLEPVQAPANYKKPEAIAAYVAEKTAEQAERSGLDVDLCRITGIGVKTPSESWVATATCEQEEKDVLGAVAALIHKQGENAPLIGFNAQKFDWPVLMRRALYLGVDFPVINLDRYRSPHVDLFAKLTNFGQLPGHSLRFYAARLGWLDIHKPLMGDEEARVFETKKWDELSDSIQHDVTATERLAKWLGVIA